LAGLAKHIQGLIKVFDTRQLNKNIEILTVAHDRYLRLLDVSDPLDPGSQNIDCHVKDVRVGAWWRNEKRFDPTP
jgi:hypothetical protein